MKLFQKNEEWTVKVVAFMHRYRISNSELAKECGYSTPYISSLLNGKKSFQNSKSKALTISRISESLEKIKGRR